MSKQKTKLIRISNKVKTKLEKMKIIPKESYNDVVFRLIKNGQK